MPKFKKSAINRKDWHLRTFWLVITLFVSIFWLEFATPPEYVFGYLYVGPIVISSTHLSRKTTLQLTILACLFTLANLCFPHRDNISVSTWASRLIATFALVVTGILSDRNRLYQEEMLQQEAKLQAAEQLAGVRENFTATLAHDLKTPLLGAIEALKALERGNFGAIQAEQKQVFLTMIRSHQTTLQIIETLLLIYRNDSEGLELSCHPVDLRAIAEEATKPLLALAANRRIHISFNYGDSDFRKFLWVNGDSLQLMRVLTNLLINAINHSPRGGKIEVVLEAGSSMQTVKVMDTGAGIEEIPYLFERFYQGKSDRQVQGVGLGLYLSRQIIEAHGGTIWAENRYPVGAMFAFGLPTLSVSRE